jgi:hypothetical protein
MRRFLGLALFLIILASALGSDRAFALGYKWGLLGGYNYTSFGFSGLPKGLSANGNGGYLGLEGGIFASGEFVRPGIEISPEYVLFHVNTGNGSENIQSILIPAYFTLSFGQKNPFVDIGAGAGPILLDLSDKTQTQGLGRRTNLGVFGKVSPVVEVTRRVYLGPQIQFFWDVTPPSGTRIWGILTGLSLEIY